MSDSVTTMDLLQSNLEALREHDPVTASFLEGYVAAVDVWVEPLPEGENALVWSEPGQVHTVHRKEHYYREQVTAEINTLMLQLRRRGASGCILYGVDTGARMMRIFKETDHRCPLFIVESHPEYVKALLRAVDLRELFASKRVFLFCGKEGVSRLISFLQTDYTMFLPLEKLKGYPEADRPFYEDAQQRIDGALRELFQAHRDTSQRVQAYYQQRNAADLRQKFDPQDRANAKVLADACTDTTFLQYAVRDAMEAFASLGCTTRVITTDTGCVSGSYVYRMLSDFYPDLWFRINHVAKEYFFLSDHLITVSWIQDYMPYIFNARIPVEEKIGRYDQLIVMARHFIDDLRQAGFPEKKLHYFFHGSNTSLYRPLSLSEEDRHRYGAPVSFVSHFRDYTQVYPLLAPRIADRLYRRMAEEERFYPDEAIRLLREIEKEAGCFPIDEGLFRVKIWPPLSAAALRHPYLESLKEYGLRIFGNGWGQDVRFASCAAGSATHGDEACKVYNASAINVNLHPATNNHARIFDCLASGGFMLTWLTHEDAQPGGIADMFEVGKEIEVFRNKKELQDKIRYYLTHDQERRTIAQRGYERVLREHTIRHRMNQVLDIVWRGLQEEG